MVLLAPSHRCPDENAFFNNQTVLTTLTFVRYNNELQRQAQIKGYRYVDINDELMDYRTGKPDKYFWSDPLDYHCSAERIFYLWHKAIKHATGFEWCVELN